MTLSQFFNDYHYWILGLICAILFIAFARMVINAMLGAAKLRRLLHTDKPRWIKDLQDRQRRYD